MGVAWRSWVSEASLAQDAADPGNVLRDSRLIIRISRTHHGPVDQLVMTLPLGEPPNNVSRRGSSVSETINAAAVRVAMAARQHEPRVDPIGQIIRAAAACVGDHEVDAPAALRDAEIETPRFL